MMAITRAITSPAAGPVATVAAVILAGALGASWMSWEAERDSFRQRLAEAHRQADRQGALWKAQLTACHAAAGDGQVTEAALTKAETGDPAQRLLREQPEGIDVCARMESADQAVLSTLK